MNSNEINKTPNPYPGIALFFFWLVWGLLLLVIPFYGFTFLVELDVVKPERFKTIMSPVIGGVVLITQIAILVYAFKMFKRREALSKMFLLLLGGSVVLGFVWAGGCAIMGPISFH